MSLTGVAFLLAFGVGCILALARHPVYGLVTYIAVFYLHPPSRWWGLALPDLRWSLLAAVVTFAAVLVQRRASNAAPLYRQSVIIGLLLFLAWIILQSLWTLNVPMHQELIVTFAKYLLLVGVIYKSIETQAHLRMVIWAHVLGCLYLGLIVLEQYLGGRFEGFGGPDINEANAGALQVVTGIAMAAALLFAGTRREKIALFGMMPLILNAVVATISRSGFLGLLVTGAVFNFLTPKRYRRSVRTLSVLALVLLVLVTNPVYWTRMGSILHLGEEVEGVDTGTSRLVIVEAQWQMFSQHSLGCGHRCTATLSPHYLDDVHLTGSGEDRGRSSHNTFMTMLVEQGVPGAVFYLALTVWIGRKILALRRSLRSRDGFLAATYPAIAASLIAIFVGDLFVDFLKLEVRIWFLAFLMVLLKLNAAEELRQTGLGIPVGRAAEPERGGRVTR